jgi:hypothetical protein
MITTKSKKENHMVNEIKVYLYLQRFERRERI